MYGRKVREEAISTKDSGWMIKNKVMESSHGLMETSTKGIT